MKMNPEERWHLKPKEKTPILSKRVMIAGLAGLTMAAAIGLENESKRHDREARGEITETQNVRPEDPIGFPTFEYNSKHGTLDHIAAAIKRTLQRRAL